MALVTVSNNSLTAVTALPASIPTGSLTLIKSITASSSASISFVDGASGVVLDDTYKSYVFKFINMHASTNAAYLQFNMSTDGGSNYNVTKTSTSFAAYHNESDSAAAIGYETGNDLAQSTSYQNLTTDQSIDNDASASGSIIIFNPSSSVFAKHFIANFASFQNSNYQKNQFTAGYGNTTSAIDAVSFKFNTGTIGDGIIKLYGVK